MEPQALPPLDHRNNPIYDQPIAPVDKRGKPYSLWSRTLFKLGFRSQVKLQARRDKKYAEQLAIFERNLSAWKEWSQFLEHNQVSQFDVPCTKLLKEYVREMGFPRLIDNLTVASDTVKLPRGVRVKFVQKYNFYSRLLPSSFESIENWAMFNVVTDLDSELTFLWWLQFMQGFMKQVNVHCWNGTPGILEPYLVLRYPGRVLIRSGTTGAVLPLLNGEQQPTYFDRITIPHDPQPYWDLDLVKLAELNAQQLRSMKYFSFDNEENLRRAAGLHLYDYLPAEKRNLGPLERPPNGHFIGLYNYDAVRRSYLDILSRPIDFSNVNFKFLEKNHYVKPEPSPPPKQSSSSSTRNHHSNPSKSGNRPDETYQRSNQAMEQMLRGYEMASSYQQQQQQQQIQAYSFGFGF